MTPADIRHKLTLAERSFTSTGAKLAHHWPVFQKLRDTGYGSIIRATMTLHQVCSSRCHYCSTIARNKRDSITLDEAKVFVESLYYDQATFNRVRFPEHNERYFKATGSDIRLRGLILSGGGQPNLWPHFAEFVDWLGTLGLDLGLITNGFPSKVPESVYEKFKWVRISITPEDASNHYVDGQFNQQYIPETLKHNPRITVGYSSVIGDWTTDDLLKRIAASIEENGFSYCRTLTDCNLSRTAQLAAHNALAERLHKLGYVDDAGNPTGRIFHQLKYHGTPEDAASIFDDGQCKLQSYNCFWDTTGHEENGRSFCYPCDSVTVLAEEPKGLLPVIQSQRRFNHELYGTVTNDQVGRLYREPLKAFFDPRENCSACLFMKNNETVKQLTLRDSFDDIRLEPNVHHVNFP